MSNTSLTKSLHKHRLPAKRPLRRLKGLVILLLLPSFLSLAPINTSPVYADHEVLCATFDPAINDHVGWALRVGSCEPGEDDITGFIYDPPSVNHADEPSRVCQERDGDGNIEDYYIRLETGGCSPPDASMFIFQGGGGDTGGSGDPEADQVPAQEASCETENVTIGWLLCAIADFLMGSVLGWIRDNFIGGILEFDNLEEGPQRDALQAVWRGFRDIANVAFIIVFMIVIYSAVSGGFISAYDIRRLAPRIVLGAIGVQLSFFISTLAVNFFNAAGAGVVELMLAPVNGGSLGDIWEARQLQEMITIVDGADTLLTFGALIITIIVLILSIFGILKLLVFFILRNIVLTVLVVISPLAFVAWVLPNTDGLFKAWRVTFLSLLAFYVVMMAFLASGQLVANIWTSGNASFGNVVVAQIIWVIPMWIPERVYGALQGAGQQVVGAADATRRAMSQNRVSQYGKNLAGDAIKDSRAYAGRKSGQIFENPTRSWQRGINRAAQIGFNPGATFGPTRDYRQRAQAAGQAEFDRARRQDEEAAAVLLEREIEGLDDAQKKALLRSRATGADSTPEMRQAALKRMLDESMGDDIRESFSFLAQTQEGREVISRFKDKYEDPLGTKYRDLALADADELAQGVNLYGSLAMFTASVEQLVTQKNDTVQRSVNEAWDAIQSGDERNQLEARAGLERLVELFDSMSESERGKLTPQKRAQIERARAMIHGRQAIDAQGNFRFENDGETPIMEYEGVGALSPAERERAETLRNERAERERVRLQDSRRTSQRPVRDPQGPSNFDGSGPRTDAAQPAGDRPSRGTPTSRPAAEQVLDPGGEDLEQVARRAAAQQRHHDSQQVAEAQADADAARAEADAAQQQAQQGPQFAAPGQPGWAQAQEEARRLRDEQRRRGG